MGSVVSASSGRRQLLTSLPIMKAVGPPKGCEWTGCALSMISTPTMRQPEEICIRK